MHSDLLMLPSAADMRCHIVTALVQYWPEKHVLISNLPITAVTLKEINEALELIEISLPAWAKHCGVNGSLMVPREACKNGADWEHVDWWLAAFLMLECWHERCWEEKYGPIHSYSSKLKGWDERVWERAWVNRIGLLLREWAAKIEGVQADSFFGNLPATSVIMTHDVDAVKKTLAIRCKQFVFNMVNVWRCLFRFEFKEAFKKVLSGVRFLFSREDWWTFDRLLTQEVNAEIAAHYNFYADNRKKSVKRWLFDPNYKISSPNIQSLLSQIKAAGGIIGLHPTFDAWSASELISNQRSHLESVSGTKVSSCRQHWLRFSWARTWHAQGRAQLTDDSTMLFNDRPGFRASAALSWQPWNPQTGKVHKIRELPTILMDSHLYDYEMMNDSKRELEIERWFEECIAVGGSAAVLWHPHTLTKDYGWQSGFKKVLNQISELSQTSC